MASKCFPLFRHEPTSPALVTAEEFACEGGPVPALNQVRGFAAKCRSRPYSSNSSSCGFGDAGSGCGGFSSGAGAAAGGQLYGSVSSRDIAALVSEKGFAVNRAQIALNAPIKAIGLHKVPVSLHPEVELTINVTVARNADEAARLARGEDIKLVRAEAAEPAADAAAAAEAFFEPEVVEARRTRAAAPQPGEPETDAEKKG